MGKLITFFLFAFFLQNSYAVTVEQHGCTLFNGYGQILEDYNISLKRAADNSEITDIAISRRIYFTDLVAYSKTTGETAYNVDPYDIKENDPNYYVLKSKFITLQESIHEMKLTGKKGFYDIYESNNEASLINSVYVSNTQQANVLYRKAELKSRITFLDNKESYSLKVERKFIDSSDYNPELMTSLICPKK